MCDICGCTGTVGHFHVGEAIVQTRPNLHVEVTQALLRENDHSRPATIAAISTRAGCAGGEPDVLAGLRQDELVGSNDPHLGRAAIDGRD